MFFLMIHPDEETIDHLDWLFTGDAGISWWYVAISGINPYLANTFL